MLHLSSIVFNNKALPFKHCHQQHHVYQLSHSTMLYPLACVTAFRLSANLINRALPLVQRLWVICSTVHCLLVMSFNDALSLSHLIQQCFVSLSSHSEMLCLLVISFNSALSVIHHIQECFVSTVLCFLVVTCYSALLLFHQVYFVSFSSNSTVLILLRISFNGTSSRKHLCQQCFVSSTSHSTVVCLKVISFNRALSLKHCFVSNSKPSHSLVLHQG